MLAALGAVAAGCGTSGSGASETTAVGPGDPTAGRKVFVDARCGACHTLRAVGAQGTSGTNFDAKPPSLALALDRIAHGRNAMPAYSDQLSQQQMRDVAAYVVSASD
jgi:mono/diheme cytochrome c family protein